MAKKIGDILIIPNQKFIVKWNPRNKEHYESFGYKFTKVGDSFEVKLEELPKKSHQHIKVQCDYCGEVIEVTLTNYNRKTVGEKDCCSKCKHLKSQESIEKLYGEKIPTKIKQFKDKIEATNLEKYGCTCVLSSDEIRSKIKQTMKNKYGVNSPFESKEIREKAKETLIKNYGVDNSLKSGEVRSKAKQTMQRKYGVDNAMQLQCFIDKAKQTCIEEYGGESSQCSIEVRQKSMESLLKNGTIPTSKAEIAMVEKLKEMYGENNCIAQFPLDRIFFDCLIDYNGIKIDVEFDGSFWHDNKKDYDNRRDYFVKRKGYKVLRFHSKGNVPTEEQIKNGVEFLANPQHWRYKINI